MNEKQLAELQTKMGEAFYADVLALEDKLHQIKSWCEAYPVNVFPEPDWAKAQQLLQAGGMTIDSISASNMRHVLKGVVAIIERE